MSKNYIAIKGLPIIKRVKLIDKKKFAKVALDENVKIFVIYVTALSAMSIHPNGEA